MAVIRMKPIVNYDGTYLDRCHMSGDTFVRHRSQPLRDPALEQVKQIRQSDKMAPSNQVDSSLGEWSLSIPKSDFWNLVARNPDLNSPDPDIKTRAWDKFTASSESMPYRMRTGRY